MIRVLFVCLGNICRSPMAEAVFRHYVQEAGLSDRIVVDSAGTGDWHIGNPPHRGTRHILDANNISYENIRARQVANSDFADSHYIIAMDEQNLKDLRRLAEQAARSGKSRDPYIGKLLEFASQASVRDVPDPYYTGNFEEVFALVQEGCRGLLNFIIARENLAS
mgnify:CR=1 FL=1